jgi:hypothetical protein
MESAELDGHPHRVRLFLNLPVEMLNLIATFVKPDSAKFPQKNRENLAISTQFCWLLRPMIYRVFSKSLYRSILTLTALGEGSR